MSSVCPTSITRVVVESLTGVSHGFFIYYCFFHLSDLLFSFSVLLSVCVCVKKYIRFRVGKLGTKLSRKKTSWISWLCLRNAMDGDDLAKLNDELRTPVAEVVNKKLGEAKWELKCSIYQLVRDSSIINVKGRYFFRKCSKIHARIPRKTTPNKHPAVVAKVSVHQGWPLKIYHINTSSNRCREAKCHHLWRGQVLPGGLHTDLPFPCAQEARPKLKFRRTTFPVVWWWSTKREKHKNDKSRDRCWTWKIKMMMMM